MALRVVNQGEEIMLDLIASINYTLTLYTNDHTPVEADDETDFTEASGGGYAAKTLTGGSWTTTPGAPGVATYADQTFAFTGFPGTIYGYTLERASDGKLVLAEKFSLGPYTFGNGDELIVSPRITLQDTVD